VDHDRCVVYPPYFVGTERLPVLLWRKGSDTVQEQGDVCAALGACGLPMTPIFCGGARRVMQEGEQWACGCNVVALRQGLVASCSRTEATLRSLEQAGVRIIPSMAFLGGDVRIGETDRAVLTFEGSELVCGGGGPRCTTMPVLRDGF